MSHGRILFFADAQNIHTRRWVHEMVLRGYEAVIVTRRPAQVPGASDVIAVRPGADGAGWFLALPEVRRLARRLAPRWVHGHYVTSYGLWAAACGVRPVVLTAWGSDILVTPKQSALMRGLVGWSLRRAQLITADSRDMLDEIGRYGGAAPRHEVLWGADTTLFKPATASAPMQKRFELVSLRNWEPNYNIDVLLRTLAMFVAQRQDSGVHLSLLGGGPDEASLRALAAELGLGEQQVSFIGRVDEARMVAAMQAAQVSLSIPSSDATSVSLLESMACGLPVVVSDLPANRQWVDEVGGLVVPVRDAAALCNALLRLFDDASARRRMGQHNRAVIETRASRRSQMDHMHRLYQSLVPSGTAA